MFILKSALLTIQVDGAATVGVVLLESGHHFLELRWREVVDQRSWAFEPKNRYIWPKRHG